MSGTRSGKSNNIELPDKIAWAPMPGSQVAFLTCPVYEVLFSGTRGNGKRISDDNQILTDSGWKLVGDVTYEDRLVAPDGTYTEIQGIFKQSEGSLFRVTFTDGVYLDVDLEHRWTVRDGKSFKWSVKTTAELLDCLKTQGNKKHRNRWYIQTPDACPGKEYTGLDPYAVGLLLGDGTVRSRDATLYGQEDQLLDYMITTHGWRRYEYEGQVPRVTETRRVQSDAWKDFLGHHKGPDKHIPQEILEAEPTTRLACLQGIMDTDGCIDKDGRVELGSCSLQLIKDVQYVVRSLGGKARYNPVPERRTSDLGTKLPFYRLKITTCNKFNPFRLTRKAQRVKVQNGKDRQILSIKYIKDGPATCFAVAHPSHQFVCQDFVVTHNSDTLLMDFAKDVGQGYGADWRGVLFRRTYPELADIIDKTKKWFPMIFGDDVKFNETKTVWTWKTGEKLFLRPFESDSDYWSYHGHCLEPDSEVLTPNGWKAITEIQIGDYVYGVTPDGKMDLFPVDTKTDEYYEGDLIEYSGRGRFMRFTPGHKLPVCVDDDNHELVPYEDLNGSVTIRCGGWKYSNQLPDTKDVAHRKVVQGFSTYTDPESGVTTAFENHQLTIDQVTQVPYKGMVHCIGVRHAHSFIARQKGYSWLSGNSYPWIGWEELTTHPTPNGYLKMMSCCRSSNPRVARISRVRANTNPGGVGHNWVKARFKIPQSFGRIIRGELDASGNPEPDRVAIHGDLRENKALMDADPNYRNRIKAAASTEAEVRAWLYGDWDIISGGMFDDVWDYKVHVVQPFGIPSDWRIIRGFDWGSSKPFSLGWYAISDGSDIQLANGKWWSTVRGDHFRIGEWYGWSGKPNEGCKMLASDIARGAVERELRMGIYHRVEPGHADHAIFKTENGNCIAEDMAKPVRLDDGREYRGISFLPADKSAGSRVLGWQVVRQMLGNAKPSKTGPREKPGLFFFDNCEHAIRCLPVTPRNPLKPDDVDTDFEDHCFTGDTKVDTLDGQKTFQELEGSSGAVWTDEGFYLYRSCRLVKKNQPVVTVEMSNGVRIRCTPDHKFFLPNLTTMEAQFLHGQEILWYPEEGPFDRVFVTRVYPSGVADVYCLTVPDLGRFSVEGGAIVSNCQDEIRYVCRGVGTQASYGLTVGMTY